METSEHQEWRSRQQFDFAAAAKAAFSIGLILFYMSGGSPWSTAGTMNMILGRDVGVGFWGLLFGHFAVVFLYAWIIGMVIYRLPLVLALPAGVLTGIVLWAVNLFVFRAAGGSQQTIEFVTFFVHVVFSLYYTLVYKALSVPAPLPDRAV